MQWQVEKGEKVVAKIGQIVFKKLSLSLWQVYWKKVEQTKQNVMQKYYAGSLYVLLIVIDLLHYIFDPTLHCIKALSH